MKNILNTAALISILLASSQVMARDDQKMHPLEDALNTAAAKEKLDPQIKLFFGNQPHPAVEKTLGEWKTNKKTNGFNKSDKEACEWTLLSALLELQERASKEGGNAIINIKSNYKNKEASSETEYMCGSGALMSGVALKGDVVKLK
ncbi:excinuclease ABC subunit A [Methylobacillus caricis]|uniref:excinuclease ABC subunit A n=1 Tax=Methylobacillus caricis TaxID=1971611 RepID=UPI001CFF8745|nr:excinuclease ABC subunit A [Methylobacillus caricis]MCB5188051.1 excinuclease ABC subunit A [Methylobacillus caricis]